MSPSAFDVVQLEVHGQIVLGKGRHIAATFQKAGELQLKMAVADDAVEDALFRDEIALFFHDEGARLPHAEMVSRTSASPLSCTVSALTARLKRLQHGFGRRQLRQVAQRIGRLPSRRCGRTTRSAQTL
jgi:hypothetical protein